MRNHGPGGVGWCSASRNVVARVVHGRAMSIQLHGAGPVRASRSRVSPPRSRLPSPPRTPALFLSPRASRLSGVLCRCASRLSGCPVSCLRLVPVSSGSALSSGSRSRRVSGVSSGPYRIGIRMYGLFGCKPYRVPALFTAVVLVVYCGLRCTLCGGARGDVPHASRHNKHVRVLD